MKPSNGISLDDFIVLGRTVPEESEKYGIRVCMAGFSQQRGLARVYPLTVDNPMRSRHRAHIVVMANPQDSRKESYKLVDAVESIVAVSEKPAMTTSGVFMLAESQCYPSIAAMNAQCISLGFVKSIGQPVLVWQQRQECKTPIQLALFDEILNDLRITGFLTGKNYPRIPYIRFADNNGNHRLQLREWGCFEYLRKHDGKEEDLAEILKLNDPSRTFYFLVGNMSHRRNVWLIIQVFSHQKHSTLPLFPSVNT